MSGSARSKWICILVLAGLACCLLDALMIEPHWIKVDHVSLDKHPSVRLVHVSDLHYKGGRGYLEKIVETINGLSPDAVCFTGDIAEDTRYLKDALEGLEGIRCPLYGVPGNHEDWSGTPADQIERSFRKTGGEWLVDRSSVAAQGRLIIVGRSGLEINLRRAASDLSVPGKRMEWDPLPGAAGISAHEANPVGSGRLQLSHELRVPAGGKRILLTHYPAEVDELKGAAYDLILTGHSHGGQVRLPFLGAIFLPFGVGRYELGMYFTPAGPLHVSAGLGTFLLPARFLCRPEITIIEL